VTGFKAQTAVISHMIGEKLAEQRQLEERVKEFGREE
jgi:enhancing lycopene biosynthesis protein 2